MSLEKVLVLGLGKVGTLVATLLHQSGFKVTGIDSHSYDNLPFATKKIDVSDPKNYKKLFKESDAVVSCLPYSFNISLAQSAYETETHYFDLTEDVSTTTAIRKLSQTSKRLMAPQCGLAPGFIAIAGAHLASSFEQLRSIELRVGALPMHPRGKLGYALNWSPEGVINEYINDCEVIRMGKSQSVPALEGLEIILINGLVLESFTTSGGLGTMCETYAGKVQELNYKTIRYPGHCELMRFLLNELYLRSDRELIGKILINALPAVDEDVVFAHAAVEGLKAGKLVREEYVRAFPPLTIDYKQWRAISWTTAASISAVVELVRDGVLPQQGFLKQEEIPLNAFLNTKTGALYLEGERKGF